MKTEKLMVLFLAICLFAGCAGRMAADAVPGTDGSFRFQGANWTVFDRSLRPEEVANAYLIMKAADAIGKEREIAEINGYNALFKGAVVNVDPVRNLIVNDPSFPRRIKVPPGHVAFFFSKEKKDHYWYYFDEYRYDQKARKAKFNTNGAWYAGLKIDFFAEAKR